MLQRSCPHRKPIYVKGYDISGGIVRVFEWSYTPDEIAYRLKHYFKFAFVRHPLDRLVSAFKDRFKSGRTLQRRLYAKKIIKNYRRPGEVGRIKVDWTSFICTISTTGITSLTITSRDVSVSNADMYAVVRPLPRVLGTDSKLGLTAVTNYAGSPLTRSPPKGRKSQTPPLRPYWNVHTEYTLCAADIWRTMTLKFDFSAKKFSLYSLLTLESFTDIFIRVFVFELIVRTHR